MEFIRHVKVAKVSVQELNAFLLECWCSLANFPGQRMLGCFYRLSNCDWLYVTVYLTSSVPVLEGEEMSKR